MPNGEINPYEPPKDVSAQKKFERFSNDIRDAMKLANREAKRRFAKSIESLHLMTAIAEEPTGLGGALLRHYGITSGLIRNQSRHLWVGSEWFTIWGKLPLSANTKRSVDFAVNLAVAENHDSVGTGGVLLAMLTVDETTTDLIRALGIDFCRFKKDLERYLYRLMVESPGQELRLDPLDSTDE